MPSEAGNVHRSSSVFCSWGPLIRQGLRPATFPVGEGFLRRGPGMTGGSGRAEGPHLSMGRCHTADVPNKKFPHLFTFQKTLLFWKKEVGDMQLPRNGKLTKNAQNLRRNMTKEERHLWYDFFKQISIPVNRQKVIGHYIADFYCDCAKVVVELDGTQHYEDEGAAHDRQRDSYLESLGIQVLRYSNADIHRNFRGVCEHIIGVLEERSGLKVRFQE